MAQKRVAKKLEVTETTTHEASSSSRSSLSSRVLIMEYCMLTVDFELSQDIPSSNPADQGERTTGTSWVERLRGASVQPPLLKRLCQRWHSKRLVLSSRECRQKKGDQSPP
jgi:hypothetical protein